MNKARFSKSTVGALLLALFSAALPLTAQSTSGNLVGTVYDAAGAGVPRATIILKHDATGVETTSAAGGAGEYRFTNLPVGMYSLTVTATGFGKSQVNAVNVQLNQTLTQNVTLSVSQSTTTVEVVESAAAIDTTTAQLQNTFEVKQITDLPITASGAGVLNLALLNPGVATSGAVGSGTGPSVAGQRPRNNNFTIEGVDNNNGAVTGPVASVPNDAVAEFSTLQNQFSPDFGHSSGGQFNIVVKSGSNQFHGMLYEYFNNKNLNAGDPLSVVQQAPVHPRYDDNRFGGNVGGPIQKNKLFFFADYEYNPVGQAGSGGTVYAPTQAGWNTIAGTPGVNQTNYNILKKYLGTAPSAEPVATFGGAYPVIGALSDGPQYLASSYTGQAIQTGQISVPFPQYLNYENAVASVDFNASNADAFRGRFVLNRTGQIDVQGGLAAFFQTQPTNSYLLALSEYHTFSPTLVNELRVGYNRLYQDFPATKLPYPGLDQFPEINVQEYQFQLGGDGNAPQFTYQNTYQLTDNLTWTKGAHTLKFGFDGQRQISPQAFTQRSRGDYEYTFLSDYLFDFLPDQIAERSSGNFTYWGNRWLIGAFVNDNWKVLPNLTINLGLRYEYNSPPAAYQVQSLNAAASVPGLITFGSPVAQKDNIMPRIGIAYSPGTSGKTSIRAGFGINYDVLFDNLGLLSLPPQLSITQDPSNDTPLTNFLSNGGWRQTAGGNTLSVADARANTSGYITNNVTRPKSYQWNFGIQHQFHQNYTFETRYVGTRGTDLDTQSQLDRRSRVTAANALPVFWSTPSAATVSSLTNTLGAITSTSSILPAFAAAGFQSTITSYVPNGNSVYHGWQNQLTRRFSDGLQILASYTWSHAIDDSTADVFSTVATPRRAQDSQNLRADRASSALDHRNRITIAAVYDLPFFKHSNWMARNLIGNWELAPIYTYQTGTFFTVQSAVDSNLNGDTWPDRAILNPNGGDASIGSGTKAIVNANGDTVGYQVLNPNAKYVTAPQGTLATAGRNTEQFNPINNIDLFAAKRFTFKERFNFEFSARFFNVLNHQQYVGGYLSDVQPKGPTGTDERAIMIPNSSTFNQPWQAFSGNPRNITLGAKIIF